MHPDAQTSLALHAIANAQAAGGIAAFIDAEHALDPDYAKKLGVDTDALPVSQPDTGEQALEITDMLIRSAAIDVVVIDSVAALVPRAEIEGEMGDSHIGLQARLMSQALRKLTGAINQTKTTVIFINQLREKIGVNRQPGDHHRRPGAEVLRLGPASRAAYRDAQGRHRSDRQPDPGEGPEEQGRAPPFRQAEMDLLFGQGISRESGLIDLGVEQGIVRKSGAWYICEGDQLGQGKENARNFLRDNPAIASGIEKKIKEKLGVGPRLDAEADAPGAVAGEDAGRPGGDK